MSAEENKALVRRYLDELWEKGNEDFARDAHAPGFIDHAAVRGQRPGYEGYRDTVSSFRKAFPDLRITVEDVVAEDDKVVVRWSGAATHLGPFFGITATKRRVALAGIDIRRIAAGKIVEMWRMTDTAGLIHQLTA